MLLSVVKILYISNMYSIFNLESSLKLKIGHLYFYLPHLTLCEQRNTSRLCINLQTQQLNMSGLLPVNNSSLSSLSDCHLCMLM